MRRYLSSQLFCLVILNALCVTVIAGAAFVCIRSVKINSKLSCNRRSQRIAHTFTGKTRLWVSKQPAIDDKDQKEERSSTEVDNAFEEILNDINQKVSTSSSSVGLWLDLRGTYLSYSKALAVMEMEEFDISLIDAIILSETESTETSEYVQILKPKEENWSSIILENALNIKNSSGQNQGLLDPVSALDQINSGKWVIAGCDEVESSSKWYEHIEGLTSFLVAASRSTSNSLIMLSDVSEQQAKISNDPDSKGGLAVICKNGEDVFKGFSLSESVCGNISSENGVLIHSNTISNTKLKIALVLPLDFVTWKMAKSFLFDE